MNRLTKGVVIVSTLAAAFVELYLATTPAFPQVFWIAVTGFAVTLVASVWRPQPVVAPVVFFAYLTPALFVAWASFDHFSLEIVWLLPLLGYLVAGRGAWQWSLPAPWRWPLVAWALFVAVSWPIVFLREIDFDPSILPLSRAANTSIGISPWEAGQVVVYAAVVHSAGLLWIDALFRWFADGSLRVFRSSIVMPLAIAVAIACAVSVYQGFIDLEFINPHLWGYMRRASGTLGDANSFGVLAGMWGPAFVALALTMTWPWSIAVGVGGAGLAALGVFTSGSRTGLIVFSLGLAAVAFEGFRAWRKSGPQAIGSGRRLLPAAIAIVVVGIAVTLMVRGSSLTTVLARGSLGYIPLIGDLGIQESARQLWDRYGYGPPAVLMVREHPWAGVGIGSFHTLVHDYGVIASGRELPPDNAQNWYRHWLAELGLLSSVPWIAWCLVLAAALFARHPEPRGPGFGILRGVLIAFGVISFVGVPGQSSSLVLTFWTLVFWCVTSGGLPPTWQPKYAPRWVPAAWLLTLAIVAVHATVTLADARGDLLPRNRSKRFGWTYRYGISDVEKTPDGSPGRMWTERKSLSVIPVKGKVLKFVAWIDHPDGDERPVHVTVWADSRVVYDDDLKRSAAIFLDIPAPVSDTHMTVKTEISRTWRPKDFGRNDPRELGLSVRDWTWQ